MRTILAVSFALVVSLATIATAAPAPATAANCEFVLGFKLIHDMIPDLVGDCITNEYHNPENGDGLQETTAWHGGGGLLVWRKADNWTAFTDGAHSWVNGPYGLQKRLNTERFSWEGQAVSAPAPTPTPVPAPASRVCCKICTTGKACGNSCIARHLTCHQPPGCACNAQ